MVLLHIFLAFFKIGFFTIGGGYAMLPLIQYEIEKYGWLTVQEFVDIVAIAEMTPGPIAINAATFVGFRNAGVIGSIVATLGVSLPSFIIIVALSKFWEKYKDHPVMVAIFSGIRPVMAGLIASAAIFIAKAALFSEPLLANSGLAIDFRSILIAIGVFVAVWRYKVDPIKTILVSAAVGFFVFMG
ncbi:MAG: chromate transporter [Firmicutes bacterium]|nr:chromate transporter [Bacillota bacterium]